MKLITSLTFLLLFALSSFAEPPSEEPSASALTLAQVIYSESMLRSWPPSMKKTDLSIVEKWEKESGNTIFRTQVEIALVLGSTYSEEEIKEMLTFFSSPTGKKFLQNSAFHDSESNQKINTILSGRMQSWGRWSTKQDSPEQDGTGQPENHPEKP
tara:strand:- start:1533 stop:2000 length:468 start_codon:yes stop_codon:yes gene_type:complete